MQRQVLAQTSTSTVTAFARFLRAHAAVTSRLSSELQARHGLTMNDYEVLLRLAKAPDGRLRRVDLVESVLLTPSGITRLLDGLERDGLVRRDFCAADRRVVYAAITTEGLRRFEEASKTHLDGIRRLFSERFSAEEIDTLSELLSRLPDGAADAAECTG